MKKHAIIPIFLPHSGCPNDCVFCNQKKITARLVPPSQPEVRDMIERYLSTIEGRGIETVEIAFFGGSFTGIPMEQQNEYLSIAKDFKDEGRIHKIHLSTRPDYIDRSILDNLARYSVDIIELGVQSFDDEVLRRSNRGHSSEVVYESSTLIQEYGFTLGIQLMIGLPGDTYEKSIASARKAVQIGPSIARLYPTVIIHDTPLYDHYRTGTFVPFTPKDMLRTTKDMYVLLKSAGINIIRVGLKSTDNISQGKDIDDLSYHPAFRQLIEAEIAKDELEIQLLHLLETVDNTAPLTIVFRSSARSFSNMLGNRKSNQTYFFDRYPDLIFRFQIDDQLPDDAFSVSVLS